jgi:hypothetical protein
LKQELEKVRAEAKRNEEELTESSMNVINEKDEELTRVTKETE